MGVTYRALPLPLPPPPLLLKNLDHCCFCLVLDSGGAILLEDPSER